MTRIKLYNQNHVEAVREYAAILAAFEHMQRHGLALPIQWRSIADAIACFLAIDDTEHARDVYGDAVHQCIMMRHHRVDIVRLEDGTIELLICKTLAQRFRT